MKYRGFTIVELLIVIVVIAILAAIGIVAYGGVQERARAATIQNDLRNFRQLVEMHRAATGETPSIDQMFDGDFDEPQFNLSLYPANVSNFLWCRPDTQGNWALFVRTEVGGGAQTCSELGVTSGAGWDWGVNHYTGWTVSQYGRWW